MFDWNDLRYFLAVAKAGNCASAANHLKVSQPTVSRRIQALEEQLGVTLFERDNRGLRLRPEGERMMPLAQQMEQVADQIEKDIKQRQSMPKGTVRITTIEDFASLYIAPALPSFRRQWPGIKLEIDTSYRTLNLSQDEADISLRLHRPKQNDLVGRKITSFGYGVFGSVSYVELLSQEQLADPGQLDWMILDEPTPEMPDVIWLRNLLPNLNPVLRTSSMKTLMAAVQAGMGVAVFPRPYAYVHSGLERINIDSQPERCEIWLVVHQDKRNLPVIQTVMDFILKAMTPPPR